VKLWQRLPDIPANDTRKAWQKQAQIPEPVHCYEEAREAWYAAWHRWPHDDAWLGAKRQADATLQTAYEAVVPAGFDAAWRQLHAGEKPDWEPLLRFLEDDWIFFASGYRKAALIQDIKRAELPSHVQSRLRQVVLNVVDRRDGREFRYFCKLARKVDAPELRAALRERMTSNDPNVRRRANWALYACEQKR